MNDRSKYLDRPLRVEKHLACSCTLASPPSNMTYFLTTPLTGFERCWITQPTTFQIYTLMLDGHRDGELVSCAPTKKENLLEARSGLGVVKIYSSP